MYFQQNSHISNIIAIAAIFLTLGGIIWDWQPEMEGEHISFQSLRIFLK